MEQKLDTRPLAEPNLFNEAELPTGFNVDQLAQLMARLPPAHRDNRQWRALLLIFLNVPRLRQTLGAYFDLPRAEANIPGFQSRMAGQLSFTEKFLAGLAFHLFNPAHPLPPDGLNRMRHLDRRNFELALAAIRLACQDR